MSAQAADHRPQDISIDRAAGTVTITWADGHVSAYALAWLRANCPCAVCTEDPWAAAQNPDALSLSASPPPSTEIVGAELVGGYAIRFVWADGHDSGIYTFAALRRSCPCEECNPAGLPRTLQE
jgi:prepilin-type processing-associated H-X9-DG protein